MKILIIGGTGIISTPMTRFLAERGDEVTLYNRGKSRAEQVPRGVKQIVGDRKDYPVFEKQVAEAGYFDCVIDMIGFMPEEAESAIRAFKGGLVGQYIFCSTVDVYTKQVKNYPVKEGDETNPLPSFPYAYNKAACENLLFDAYERGILNVTIIRPAATYSELRFPGVHSFGGGTYHLDRLHKGKPIITHGDGSSIWVECHSEDVARAFINAVGNRKTFGKAYHVTGEEWMTWDRVWRTLAEAIGAPEPRFVHIPTDLMVKIAPQLASWCSENFQYNNIFDNTAARADLGFKYTISWREGVRRYIDWVDKHEGKFEDSDNYLFYDRIIEAWERLSVSMAHELKGVEGIK